MIENMSMQELTDLEKLIKVRKEALEPKKNLIWRLSDNGMYFGEFKPHDLEKAIERFGNYVLNWVDMENPNWEKFVRDDPYHNRFHLEAYLVSDEDYKDYFGHLPKEGE